jgi:general secretion pathway protein A
VGVKTLLRALTVDETASYVQHRMMAAGATRDIFTAEAAEAVHYLAQGIPRQIDRLCDLALVVGFAEGLAELTAPQIEAVSAELVTVSPE